MGLFNRNPVYVSDHGDTFELKEMKSSHLLNAITHHKKQVSTLDWIFELSDEDTDGRKNQMLHLRRINLHNTIEALVKELRLRDPDLDHNID